MASTHIDFDWDEHKAAANYRKHRITFDQAAGALRHDPRAVEDADPRHKEARLLTLALGEPGLILVVWTRSDGEVTRIVSARRATKMEKKRYASTNR